MSRLLFVLDIGFDRGGPSVHLMQDVIRAGLNEGHTVDVILKDTGGPMAVMPEEFVCNANFQYYAIKEDDEKRHGFIGRYINEVRYAKKCSKVFLKKGKYDSVFLQSNTVAFFYMRLLKKLRCRMVFNVQDIFPYNLKLSGQLPIARVTFPIFRKLQNMAYQMADAIITISDDMKQTLIEDGVDSDKIEVVYNWSYADTPITVERIEPENVFDLHLDHEKFNVVYAGNIGKMQNVELVAETAIRIKDNSNVHFYIIGDGANKAHIEERVRNLLNVTMLPMQPSKYAESIYAQADMNIIPLMPGGIKTALPSKTATILRVNKPVVFCIDKHSLFSNNLKRITDVLFVDCRNTDELTNVLNNISTSKNRKMNERDILSILSCSNSKKYVEIIRGVF